MAHEEFFRLLKEEHQKVQKTLDMLEEGTGSRSEHWMHLKNDLIPHIRGEEKNFYPTLESKSQAKEDAKEAVSEHEEAESILEEIDKGMSEDGGRLPSRFSDFKEAVQHHVEEEESTIFEDARQWLSENEIEAAMEAFQKEKQRMLSTMAA